MVSDCLYCSILFDLFLCMTTSTLHWTSYRYNPTLALATLWSLYPDSCFRNHSVFSDLNPSDGGWSQNPMETVNGLFRSEKNSDKCDFNYAYLTRNGRCALLSMSKKATSLFLVSDKREFFCKKEDLL